MNGEKIAEALANHTEARSDRTDVAEQTMLTAEERRQLRSLIRLADRLQERMQPVSLSPSFVRSLRGELVEEAERQMKRNEKKRRMTMIGAAIVGSIVSVASVVGAIVVVVRWLRTRQQAHHATPA